LFFIGHTYSGIANGIAGFRNEMGRASDVMYYSKNDVKTSLK
jgi:hypothetical protein